MLTRLEAVACLALLLQTGIAWAQGPSLMVAGPAVTVFRHATDACDALDAPDAPARAIRTGASAVQLYAPHFVDRRLVGPDLMHLHPDCRVVFQGAASDDPAAFDDRAWIASLSTRDGVVVHAVVHEEFQGNRRPWLCPSGRYMDCWYNALVAATSTDGGRTFHRDAPGAAALVAALPIRFEAARGHHAGYFNPSGMVDHAGATFMMAFATAAGAQAEGNCLMRTPDVADPHAWRAWDGAEFGVRFVDPYAATPPAGPHNCIPVDPPHLRWPVTSLVRHRPSGRFVALMQDGARRAEDGGGVFYSSSVDLLHWSEPERLLPATGLGRWRCGDPNPPVAYPSLLDPASSSSEFADVGDTAVLFLTRLNMPGCRLTMDRDLVRLPMILRP